MAERCTQTRLYVCSDLSGPEGPGGGSENDQPCQFLLNSNCPAGAARPTAQVLPVQTDSSLPPSPSSSFSLTQCSYQPQCREPQPSLSPVSNPTHSSTAYRKSWVPQLSTAEDRMKLQAPSVCGAGAGFSGGVGLRQESSFTRVSVDRPLALQDSLLCRGLAGAAVGAMVETSSAMTATSNSLHHVSHPPLHFHLSSSSSPSPSGYYSCLPISISLHPSSSGSAGIPVAAVPGNSYHPRPPTSSVPPPLSASSLHQSPAQTSSACACTSCGCQENGPTYGALPGYAMSGYLQPLSADPSLFSLGPLIHLSPLLATSNSGATSFSYPVMVPSPIYRHSPGSHDQHQGFAFYQPYSVIGNGSQKRAAGSLSCYNCGSGGHKAETCKQPTMEPAQQGLFVFPLPFLCPNLFYLSGIHFNRSVSLLCSAGTFRLKYHPHSDSKN